jgi:hypothetical protein
MLKEFKSMQGNPKRVVLNTSTTAISTAQTMQIATLLSAKGIQVDSRWDWAWRSTYNMRGILYSGTLFNRLLKLHRVRLKEEPDADFVRDISAVLKPQLSETTPVYLDYTTVVDWQPGDFGDQQSRFFDWRERNPQENPFAWMARYGQGFVRMYDDCKIGRARAFALYRKEDGYLFLTGISWKNITDKRNLKDAIEESLGCTAYNVNLYFSQDSEVSFPIGAERNAWLFTKDNDTLFNGASLPFAFLEETNE